MKSEPAALKDSVYLSDPRQTKIRHVTMGNESGQAVAQAAVGTAETDEEWSVRFISDDGSKVMFPQDASGHVTANSAFMATDAVLDSLVFSYADA